MQLTIAASVGVGALAICIGGLLAWEQFWNLNFGQVVPGQVYRSAQPSPNDLRKWTGRCGLKTIVNLRGVSKESFYAAEHQFAEQAGLRMIDITLSADRLPTRYELLKLIDALEYAAKPMLLHCYRGVDRTGVASVLAAMAVGGKDFALARKELACGLFRRSSAEITTLFDEYDVFRAANGQEPGGWEQFRKWAVESYYPYYYHVDISAPVKLTVAPGGKLIVPVTITNRSGKTIPAGAADKKFTLACYCGSAIGETPDRELGLRAFLPRRDIAPGQSVTVEFALTAPAEAGEFDVHFDVIEEGFTWFAHQGSPTPTCRLSVANELPTTAPTATGADGITE